MSDATQTARRARRVWVLAGAVSIAAALLAAGSQLLSGADHPEAVAAAARSLVEQKCVDAEQSRRQLGAA